MKTHPLHAAIVSATGADPLRLAWRRLARQARFEPRWVAGPVLAALALFVGVPMVLAAAAAPAPLTLRPLEGPTDGRSPEERHADAMRIYLAQRWPLAYVRFAELADRGHAPSALMALMMVRHGSWMFGSEWSATPQQLQHWGALVLQDLADQGPLLSGELRVE